MLVPPARRVTWCATARLPGRPLYLPALRSPVVGRQIARCPRRALRELLGPLLRRGRGPRQGALLRALLLQYETPNPRTLLVQLDGRLAARTGATCCATSATPLRHRRAQLRGVAVDGAAPMTCARRRRNSFWAFARAGPTASTSPPRDWYARHDRVYFESCRAFPCRARARCVGPARALDQGLLRGAKGKRAVRDGLLDAAAAPGAGGGLSLARTLGDRSVGEEALLHEARSSSSQDGKGGGRPRHQHYARRPTGASRDGGHWDGSPGVPVRWSSGRSSHSKA